MPAAVPQLDPAPAQAALGAGHLGAVELGARRLRRLDRRLRHRQHRLAPEGLGLQLVLGRPARARPAPRAAARRPSSGSRRPRGGSGPARRSGRVGGELGPRIDPSETERPPASTTAIDCAAASRRDHDRATWRSGGGIGVTVPRSGQVPTTTSTPSSTQPPDRLAEVAHRLRRQHRVRHVVGADRDHGDVGRHRQRRDLPAEVGGLGAHLRPRCAGTPAGSPARPPRTPSTAPVVCWTDATPYPAELESPSSATLMVGPGRPRPYQPVASGGSFSSRPMLCRASLACGPQQAVERAAQQGQTRRRRTPPLTPACVLLRPCPRVQGTDRGQ